MPDAVALGTAVMFDADVLVVGSLVDGGLGALSLGFGGFVGPTLD